MKEAMKRTLDESTGNSLMSKDEAELAKDLVESMKKLMGPSFKIGCVKEVEERPDTNKKQFDQDMDHHFGEHQKDNFFIDLAGGCELEEDDTPTTNHA
ncbi:unnamed protein product [Caenorhabditis nigoni]